MADFHNFFPNPATLNMEKIIDFHHNMFFFLILLSFIMFWFLVRIHVLFISSESFDLSKIYYKKSSVTHNTTLEVMWTLLPCIFLVFMTVPSLSLIYSFQSGQTSDLVMKVMGNQWWWAYEWEGPNSDLPLAEYELGANEKGRGPIPWWVYSSVVETQEFMELSCFAMFTILTGIKSWMFEWSLWECGCLETKIIECRLMDDMDLTMGQFSLLETTSSLILPRNLQMSMVVTSNDVLHSWAVPSLGIKIDACPGSLNEVQFLMYREGLFFGQCSEMCGFYHGFMPIVIEATDTWNFLVSWGYRKPPFLV